MTTVGPNLHKAVIQNDYEQICEILNHNSATTLKKLYIALKYSKFDLYQNHIRVVARNKVRLQAARALVLKLDLPMDMCLCIANYI